MIHYHCRHCESEIGSLPFESAKEALLLIKKMDEMEQQGEQFLVHREDGALVVRCICEQCEQVLKQFPGYYALEKWLQ